MKKITADFKETDEWQKINNNAFPKEERMDIEQIIQLIDENIFEVWAFYDEEQFVGYCALVTDEKTAYIFFWQLTVRNVPWGMEDRDYH